MYTDIVGQEVSGNSRQAAGLSILKLIPEFDARRRGGAVFAVNTSSVDDEGCSLCAATRAVGRLAHILCVC